MPTWRKNRRSCGGGGDGGSISVAIACGAAERVFETDAYTLHLGCSCWDCSRDEELNAVATLREGLAVVVIVALAANAPLSSKAYLSLQAHC